MINSVSKLIHLHISTCIWIEWTAARVTELFSEWKQRRDVNANAFRFFCRHFHRANAVNHLQSRLFRSWFSNSANIVPVCDMPSAHAFHRKYDLLGAKYTRNEVIAFRCRVNFFVESIFLCQFINLSGMNWHVNRGTFAAASLQAVEVMPDRSSYG